jgi:hypothetical protein
MWISRQIVSAQAKPAPADVAQVTGSSAAQGVNEYRGLPFAGPWGIAYQPPNAASAVIVATNAGDTCIGTMAQNKNLQPGELLLYSSGGAEIYLKNSGDIVINGQVFKKAGT